MRAQNLNHPTPWGDIAPSTCSQLSVILL